MEFARLQFALSVPEGDAGTRRDHIEAAARSGSAAAQAELDEAAAADPGASRYLWDWFLELHSARGSTGFGPAALSYSEIEAWARLTGRRPSALEVFALKGLDQAYLEIQGTAQLARSKSGSNQSGRHG